jgi:hypothetical protein
MKKKIYIYEKQNILKSHAKSVKTNREVMQYPPQIITNYQGKCHDTEFFGEKPSS